MNRTQLSGRPLASEELGSIGFMSVCLRSVCLVAFADCVWNQTFASIYFLYVCKCLIHLAEFSKNLRLVLSG
jgi:hypothetical protein